VHFRASFMGWRQYIWHRNKMRFILILVIFNINELCLRIVYCNYKDGYIPNSSYLLSKINNIDLFNIIMY